jgi:hypothetical protein
MGRGSGPDSDAVPSRRYVACFVWQVTGSLEVTGPDPATTLKHGHVGRFLCAEIASATAAEDSTVVLLYRMLLIACEHRLDIRTLRYGDI